MATLTFFLRESSNKHFINLSFSWKRGAAPFRRSLGIEIDEKLWDDKKNRVKNVSVAYLFRNSINNRLDEITKWFEVYVKNHPEINKHSLKIDFDNYINNNVSEWPDALVEFIDKYLTDVVPVKINQKTKEKIGKRVVQHYETTRRWLVKYENDRGAKIFFKEMGLDFHSSLLSFLLDKNGLSKNTVGGYIKNIKMFAKEAGKRDLVINKETLTTEFYLPKEESVSVYLNEKEIVRLFDYHFDSDRLKKVRDWAIIGCWTGLRISDWSRIKKIEDNLITIKTKKTGKTVVIPLHPQVKEIIKNGFPESVSDVEFNRVIKKVCKKVGFDDVVEGSVRDKKTNRKKTGMFKKYKLITSHTCRRSFATNLYKSGFPSISIMAITGHTTEANFLKYIKVTPTEHALRLARHWDVMN